MRKILLIGLFASIVLFGSIKFFLWRYKPTDSETLKEKAKTLPGLSLTTLEGKPYSLERGKAVVIIYFNSTCDHCQRQIDTLKESQSLFEGISLVLMSAQPHEELVVFASTLNSAPGISVVHCQHAEIGEKFGVLSLPQIFVYDREGNLAGLFAGETAPGVIAASLKRQ